MKSFIKAILPSRVFHFANAQRKQLKSFKNLSQGYRQYKGLLTGTCLNAQGEVCPWYTYPALDYLIRLDLSDASVFEFGSGYSTLYYAQKARHVTSVEHNAQWFEKCKSMLPKHVDLIQAKEDVYVQTLADKQAYYDVLVIDAILRSECAAAVKEQVLSYGAKLIIFDNSDWFENDVQSLAEELGWLRVPMRGFGPLNDYAWQTDFLINPQSFMPIQSAKDKPVGQR